MAREKKKARIETLSPGAQATIKKRRLAGAGTVQYWTDLMSELAGYDSVTDQLESKANSLTCGAIAVTFLIFVASVIATVVSAQESSRLGWNVGLGCGGVLAVAITVVAILGRKMGTLNQENLANDFRLILIPLLEELGEDIRDKAPVKVDIDLTGPVKEKITSKKEIPPGRFKKVMETVYVDPWCRMILPLEDKSAVVLLIENTFIQQDRSFTSSSGKYKTKTKWKKLVEVTATLAPGVDDLAFDKSAIDSRAVQEKLKLREKPGAKVLRLTRKFKFTSETNPPDTTVQAGEIVGMLMEMYSLLTPAADPVRQ